MTHTSEFKLSNSTVKSQSAERHHWINFICIVLRGINKENGNRPVNSSVSSI